MLIFPYFTRKKNTRRELTDQHLVELSERIPNEVILRRLGTALGLESHEIQSAKSNNKQDITTAAYDMLQTWYLSMNNGFIAWKEIVKGLEKAKLNMLKNVVLAADES